MPFTWKNKTRRNRFSQLVADHLQSPKRRRSLVVETGFPTSLIDLYVRNHGRFRKSSAKKPRGNDSPNQSSSSSGSFVDSNNSSSRDSDSTRTDEIVGEIKIENCREADVARVSVCSEIEAERGSETVKLNPVLVVILKVLFMVVLVLGSKIFTVAITLSAFVLCFMESVGRLIAKQTTTVCSEGLAIEEKLEAKQKKIDEVGSEVLIEIRGKSSRRAMMKSRIKKLVPKKLRIRKSSVDSKQEICCEFKEEETVVCLNECDNEELGTDSPQNSGCLVLVLIVLVGLIGGRVLAVVSVVFWCLMLRLQWRNLKFPIS